MTRFAIIISLKDRAALNIKNHLIKDFGFEKTAGKCNGENIYQINGKIKLYTITDFSVFAENMDKKIDADFFVFATKHKSEKGVPSLSVHSPGNWGKADFGGKSKELSLCPAGYLKKALQLLEKDNIEGFEAILECTHHGPYIEKPCMFIEIGSTEKEWVRDDAGKVIAKVIVELLTTEIGVFKTAVGIGGPHHAPNFKKIQLGPDIAVGHACPKYNLENLDREMILQAIERTVPKAELAIVDWKGLGENKERIVSTLNELGVEWKKTRDY